MNSYTSLHPEYMDVFAEDINKSISGDKILPVPIAPATTGLTGKFLYLDDNSFKGYEQCNLT